MADPKANRFKAMSWDNKEKVLEQLTQEIHRDNEERIEPESIKVVETRQEATKTIEIPQVTPVQDRNFFEVQAAQGMGGLMYQHAHLLMKQM
jgi:outer membrane biosynthesis protein TonB